MKDNRLINKLSRYIKNLFGFRKSKSEKPLLDTSEMSDKEIKSRNRGGLKGYSSGNNITRVDHPGKKKRSRKRMYKRSRINSRCDAKH